MAFRGTFDYSLDAKNRLTVPAKFRSALSDGVVVAKHDAGCLVLWRAADYETETEQSLADLPRFSDERDRLQRWFNANAFDAELDSAGRIGMPAQLLAHAGLTKEVVVTGSGDHLEIWDREAWAKADADLAADVQRIRARLSDAG